MKRALTKEDREVAGLPRETPQSGHYGHRMAGSDRYVLRRALRLSDEELTQLLADENGMRKFRVGGA